MSGGHGHGPRPYRPRAANSHAAAVEGAVPGGSDPGLLGEVADAPTPSVYCATSAAADANSGSNQPVSTDVGAGATSPAGHVAQPAVSPPPPSMMSGQRMTPDPWMQPGHQQSGSPVSFGGRPFSGNTTSLRICA